VNRWVSAERSLSNDVLVERDLKRFVVDEMTRFVDHFTQRLKAARDAGELPGDFDVDAAAQILVTYLQGVFRVIDVLQTRAQVEAQIELLLKGLRL
jgi:hypothetical protein